MRTIVKGHSDDTVCIYVGDPKCTDAMDVPSWDRGVKISFDDGTQIRADYIRGAWCMEVLKEGGAAWYTTEECDGLGDKSTDIFVIDAEVTHWELVKKLEVNSDGL